MDFPDMATQEECVKAVESVGFTMMEARDMALDDYFGGDPLVASSCIQAGTPLLSVSS